MDRATAIYARTLGDLKSRLGVSPADILPEETVALVRACEKAANPYADVNADAAGFPVRVCDGVWFWKLTIGAAVWLEETADRWWSDDWCMYRNALIYAAVNARDANAFRTTDRVIVTDEIRETLRRVTATSEEVDAALDRIIGIDSVRGRDDIEASATSWAELLAKIECGTGIPREHWLWGVSYSETLRSYNEMRSLANASSGKKSERMLDELDRSVNALQVLKVNIMKRVRGNG